jgi:outer membrane protein TolC
MASERAFLPSLGIGATLDGSYSNYQNIEIFPQPGVEFGSFYGWGINASVSLPIFDGGVTIGRLRQARATESAAAHQLGGATLLAMAEVEGAATQEAEQTARYEAVLSQASAAKAAMDAALSRYKDGVLDYLTLLSTLRAQQEAELAAVQAQRDLLSARMSLYDALGGAWTESFARTSSGGR